MRIKTIFLIIVVVLLTVVIMQNNQSIVFNFLFWHPVISNLVVMAFMAVAGLVIGVLIARPRRIKIDDSHPSLNNPTGTPSDTLSDEDRDYIS